MHTPTKAFFATLLMASSALASDGTEQDAPALARTSPAPLTTNEKIVRETGRVAGQAGTVAAVAVPLVKDTLKEAKKSFKNAFKKKK